MIEHLPSSSGDKARLCRHACMLVRFNVRCFRSNQEFNGNGCGSRALVLRGTCMFRTVINKIRQASVGCGDNGASTDCSDGTSGHSVVQEPRCNYYVELLSTSDEFLDKV